MIERLVPADIDRCMDLSERVGWPRETRKWALLLALGPAYGVRFAQEHRLAAMVAVPTFQGASFVAMMVVDPDRQGAGLGKALLQHALAEGRGPFLLYATSAGRPLYERLGFRAVDGVRKWVGVPHATVAPYGVRPATASDHEWIRRVDRSAFGADREALLDALFRIADRVVVDEHSGVAFRWSNGAGSIVGPVIARDEAAAIALVDGAMEGCATRARIDVVESSTRLALHAGGLGLADLGAAPLMAWPDAVVPGDRRPYHAICLQAFG